MKLSLRSLYPVVTGIALFIPHLSSAALVQVNFSAQITRADQPFLAGAPVHVGDVITGSFQYDTDGLSNQAVFDFEGRYRDFSAGSGLSLTIGGLSLGTKLAPGSSGLQLNVVNNSPDSSPPTPDSFGIVVGIPDITIDGAQNRATLTNFSMGLTYDYDRASIELPTTFDFSDLLSAGIFLQAADRNVVIASITQMSGPSVVPLPGAGLLLGSALLGLARASRLRTRRR